MPTFPYYGNGIARGISSVGQSIAEALRYRAEQQAILDAENRRQEAIKEQREYEAGLRKEGREREELNFRQVIEAQKFLTGGERMTGSQPLYGGQPEMSPEALENVLPGQATPVKGTFETIPQPQTQEQFRAGYGRGIAQLQNPDQAQIFKGIADQYGQGLPSEYALEQRGIGKTDRTVDEMAQVMATLDSNLGKAGIQINDEGRAYLQNIFGSYGGGIFERALAKADAANLEEQKTKNEITRNLRQPKEDDKISESSISARLKIDKLERENANLRNLDIDEWNRKNKDTKDFVPLTLEAVDEMIGYNLAEIASLKKGEALRGGGRSEDEQENEGEAFDVDEDDIEWIDGKPYLNGEEVEIER